MRALSLIFALLFAHIALAQDAKLVTRKGIYPPIADADKIQIIEMDELDTQGFAEKRKEFRKIFFQ